MTSDKLNLESLKDTARKIREDILKMTNKAGSGHPGGSLSAVEIIISLYEYQMRYDPKNPKWDGRDYLIISKGHASPVIYAVLARYGFFPEEELLTFRQLGSRLQGHVHRKVPGIEFNTGSLGHGLSVANGIALGAKLLKKDTKVYCIMGDGEIQEGSVWEAAMTASHQKIDNVCAIVDYNKVQENGPVEEIKSLEPLAEKWKSFGWETIEINGHNFKEIKGAFDKFNNSKGKPFAIIAHTVKGKGVTFMEGNREWHGKAPNAEELKKALEDINNG
ncbi:MAG: transketolase [Candidatus Omnitrophica bacterium]|nr:transketolase [Candidatus Omnitrophota bacterium]